MSFITIQRIILRRQERKINLEILKKANVLLIKFFYKAQGVEAGNNQSRNKAITIPVYTRSIHRV